VNFSGLTNPIKSTIVNFLVNIVKIAL